MTPIEIMRDIEVGDIVEIEKFFYSRTQSGTFEVAEISKCQYSYKTNITPCCKYCKGKFKLINLNTGKYLDSQCLGIINKPYFSFGKYTKKRATKIEMIFEDLLKEI